MWNTLLTRHAFLQFVVDLMRGYRKYISWDGDNGSFKANEFCKDQAEFSAAPYFLQQPAVVAVIRAKDEG